MYATIYLCDRAPVQEHISTMLSKLIWCLVGTKEEDAYVGQLYLDFDKDECLGGVGGDDSGVSWRLIFTTGTIDTQRKLGGTKINYFPLKATQSFDKTKNPWLIQNGIYAPFNDEFALLKFEGDFDWTFTEKTGLTKVTFDFSRIQLFNGLFDIPLKKGEAASLGAKSGLGSENNVKLTKKGKRPFFNWISADERIATARGGGGGIALWKRI